MTIHVHVRRSFADAAEEWFFWDRDASGVYVMHWDRAKRAFERTFVGIGGAIAIPTDLEPTLTVPWNLSKPLSQALVEALSNDGFVSERHEGARAKLEAVTGHLEDMRKLVFERRDQTFTEELIKDLKWQTTTRLSELRDAAHEAEHENERLERIQEGDKCEIRGLHQERDRMIQDMATLRDQLGAANVAVAQLTNRLKRKRRR